MFEIFSTVENLLSIKETKYLEDANLTETKAIFVSTISSQRALVLLKSVVFNSAHIGNL